MTVGELIEQLREFPEDYEVYCTESCEPLENIEIVHTASFGVNMMGLSHGVYIECNLS